MFFSAKSRVMATVHVPANPVAIDLERIRNALDSKNLSLSTVKNLVIQFNHHI